MSEINYRRHDIDWIRVIAIGLLLIYHITISFQPWGIFFQFIQNKESLEILWIPMSLLNVWRIPILFFISGMGVFFAMKKRKWKLLLLERSRRILVPLIFGYFIIVPIHVFFLQKYYHIDFNYSAGFGHLWFLKNIFIYVIILFPIFFLLKSNYNSLLFRFSRKVIRFPIGIYIFLLPFIIEVLIIQPESFSIYLTTNHGFWIGLLAFFFGFYFVALGNDFWNSIAKLKFINLIIALCLFLIRWLLFDFKAPLYLISIESVLWIFTIFGLGYSYLNFKNKWIDYLSKAAYPIYIIHMSFLYLSNYFIFPLNLNVALKYIIVIILTFAGSFVFYEVVINRNKFLRPLFGLNYNNKRHTTS
jgi:peptidoglycan/LPS O-acetylase OafA/YrhL